MKIRKPDDEKFFKDIVLNDILVEISNENGDLPENASPAINKKYSNTTIVIIFLVILTLVVSIVFWYTPKKSTITKKQTTSKNIKTLQSWKMDEDITGYKKTNSKKIVVKKIISEKSIPQKVIKNKTIPKSALLKSIPIQKTQRELAKEALRQQMLN